LVDGLVVKISALQKSIDALHEIMGYISYLATGSL